MAKFEYIEANDVNEIHQCSGTLTGTRAEAAVRSFGRKYGITPVEYSVTKRPRQVPVRGLWGQVRTVKALYVDRRGQDYDFTFYVLANANRFTED